MPDTTRPFQIEADASKYASGAVLTQTDSNGARHPIAYLSKTFNPTERNYEIYDRELLAIMRALKEWRHYVQGSPHPVVILSDHKNLTYFRSTQKLNRQQARWALTLSEYDIELKHTPGSQMIQSDNLSRRPDHIPDEDHDNEDQVLLPDSLFLRLIDNDLQDLIADSDRWDELALDALNNVQKNGPNELTKNLNDWAVQRHNGKPILFY